MTVEEIVPASQADDGQFDGNVEEKSPIDKKTD